MQLICFITFAVDCIYCLCKNIAFLMFKIIVLERREGKMWSCCFVLVITNDIIITIILIVISTIFIIVIINFIYSIFITVTLIVTNIAKTFT